MKKNWVLRHCDLDLWPKVTNFNRVWASAASNHLAKTASKLVHPFGLILLTRKKSDTHTQTNWSENITPPRFHGGVKIKTCHWRTYTYIQHMNRIAKKLKIDNHDLGLYLFVIHWCSVLNLDKADLKFQG